MASKFDFFSPTDYRYSVKDLEQFLSEEAFVRYKSGVEAALAKVLARRGVIPAEAAQEIETAAMQVTAEEVYAEERRIGHDVRAQVNMIRKRLSPGAQRFVHATATSFDIVDTANAARYKDATEKIILPDMAKFEDVLMELARKHRNTLQIGRTHLQHAEPITFGFGVAQFVERFGDRIVAVEETAGRLTGKFSGAVGAYNAQSLFFDDPVGFEQELLAELHLTPARISTQIVPAEPMADYMHSLTTSFGVLANFARNMRRLQSTEIAEVSEPFERGQVGSSTMPQKRNPISFENVESLWKEIFPRMGTVYMNQVSEHERDLTNSAAERWYVETPVLFDSALRRLARVTKGMNIYDMRMRKNLGLSSRIVASEPLQILLAFHGHPDAHSYVSGLVGESARTGKSVIGLAMQDPSVREYMEKFTPQQMRILSNPRRYTGEAALKVDEVCGYWAGNISHIIR